MDTNTIDRVRSGWGDKLDIFERRWLSADDSRKRINIAGQKA